MKNKLLSITVQDDLKEQLIERARNQRQSVSAYVRRIIVEHLRDGILK